MISGEKIQPNQLGFDPFYLLFYEIGWYPNQGMQDS
jgi:hypothetical protein